MADETYLSYEQVLQELQIDRSQLNRLIREGLLEEQVVDGETKFAMSDMEKLKDTLEKRETIVEDGSTAPSRTEFVEAEDEGEEITGEIVLETPSRADVERDTEILIEGEELELEGPEEEEPGPPSHTALETELELEPTSAPEPEEPEEKEEDFFDFSADLQEGEIELEGGGEVADEEEEPEIVTDILDLDEEEEVAEEDLLSEIMEIGEEDEEAEMIPVDESEDLTAEITTLEEPTYEESALDEVLAGEGDVDFGVEAPGEEFEVPYAAPVAASSAEVSGGWVAVLVGTLVIMLICGLIVMENSFNPGFSSGLLGWLNGLLGI